jgi:hypothetical protein
MTQLSNWNKTVVPQRHITGCVPTGYEWLIRYLNIQGVNLETFQEDFDLGQDNSFNSVAANIRRVHPAINIQTRIFTKGIDKVNRVKSLLEAQKPCLLSLALGEEQGWHIMPVVCIDETTIEMIHDADAAGNHTWNLPITAIVWRHENLHGGNDVSWIDST